MIHAVTSVNETVRSGRNSPDILSLLKGVFWRGEEVWGASAEETAIHNVPVGATIIVLHCCEIIVGIVVVVELSRTPLLVPPGTIKLPRNSLDNTARPP